MIAAIIVALIVSVIIYGLATLIVQKLPVPPPFAWVVWLVAILLIILVWWRVIEPYVGPLL